MSIVKGKRSGLRIRADWSQATGTVEFATGLDSPSWRITPFQVADARHDKRTALRLVAKWLRSETP